MLFAPAFEKAPRGGTAEEVEERVKKEARATPEAGEARDFSVVSGGGSSAATANVTTATEAVSVSSPT
jgi:hypothetical protein